MKAVKNILFLDQDSCSLNPLFEAILRQAAHSDSVLSTAGLRVDSAEIEYPGTGVSEGKQPASEVRSSLDSLGFEGFLYTSKNIKLHPHLISWADLILVPGLVEEDLLCMFSHEAWSKTIEIDIYCGKPPGSNLLSSYSTGPKSKEEYLSIAATFKMLLPELINRIKDSYASHLIVKGRGIVDKKNQFYGATALGYSSVVRSGPDLMNFTKGNILVVDRLGAILHSDIDKHIASSVIKKLVKSPEFYDDKSEDIQNQLELLMASFKKTEDEKVSFSQGQAGKNATPQDKKFFPDAMNAIAVVIKNAKAVVCSRGRLASLSIYSVPYISCCIGATEYIKGNQLIVVDAARGEVYDAMALRGN